MDETIFLTFSDIDKGRINTRQNIFNRTKVNITDLVTTLGNNQLINTVIGENCGDPQLLGDDNLLGHGEVRGLWPALLARNASALAG
jgi:hypothetical protein